MRSQQVSAVIIGGGPAGCQCALWLKMLGHDPVIIEATELLGGLQAQSPYQNHWIVGMRHRSGKNLAAEMALHIKEMNIPVLFKTEPKTIQLLPHEVQVMTETHTYHAAYLVIASGVVPRRDHFIASHQVFVGPGEAVFHADFSGKRVAIFGGGDNAYENQAFITQKGATLCHIYQRTQRARASLVAEVNAAAVFSGAYQANQTTMQVTHDGVAGDYDVFVVLYGWEANIPHALQALTATIVGEDGYIETNAYCQTKEPRIFAIGEVANRMHPCVVTAMADGVVAAKAIQAGLEL